MADNLVTPVTPWESPDPRQLPFLRMGLLDQLRSPAYLDEVALVLSNGRGTIHPRVGTPHDNAAAMLYDESARLSAAKLWSVSEDMVALAVQAGRNLPSWKLSRHDVPSASGFIVYDTPIADYVNVAAEATEAVSIVAVSWGPSSFITADGLWVTFWSMVDHEGIARTAKHQYGWPMAKGRAFSRQDKPSGLTWDNEVVMAFDDHRIRIADQRDAVDPTGRRHLLSTTTVAWAQTLRATWLLLKPSSRKITEAEQVHLPRTIARRQQRAGVTDSSNVTIVRVHSSRHRQTAPSSQHEGGKLNVRFPVSGHIRWQPYPSRDTIEPIFIDTYDKGPKDAPYRVGKHYTVHRLDRPPS